MHIIYFYTNLRKFNVDINLKYSDMFIIKKKNPYPFKIWTMKFGFDKSSLIEILFNLF